MKKKGIIALGLIGALSISGGTLTFAQISKNTVPKNEVMTESSTAQVSNKNETYKKVALDAFKKYFNVDVDVMQNSKGLKIEAIDTHETLAVSWLDKSRTMVYDAIIDKKTNKIIRLSCYPEDPKNEDYQNLSYDTAKDIADKFVKDNNLFNNTDYEFVEKESIKKNSELGKKAQGYVFYYNCNGEEWTLVVNKDLQKVEQFQIFPEGERGVRLG
ncbi:YcdB/YcdC domain-containing protein [Bacillus sp. FSL L8-0099]|uniref:YcdB/YcdC domain-containing protein n=1 Tax=unclassified Bacillus (in: firmicutes) TaxID=185979 RepID=UPI0030F5A8D2